MATNALSFYSGKRVFVTGHTGFKGSWLCRMLQCAGAELTGYALDPPTEPSLFREAKIAQGMRSVIGDVRDADHLFRVFDETAPEVVFHLAAQPLVRRGYRLPVETFEINLMGTVNVLQCLRRSNQPVSAVIVTTDKVYRNRECDIGYNERDELGGSDPYAGSKACAEIACNVWRESYLAQTEIAMSTVRAGNVIGGGDFAAMRIIPDCVRAALANRTISIRNPRSIRPYQHVLEALFAYLILAARQVVDPSIVGCYNVGPDTQNCMRTSDLVDIFCRIWGGGLSWATCEDDGPAETGVLQLDSSKAKEMLGWRPSWNVAQAVERVVEWTRVWQAGEDVARCMDAQARSWMQSFEANEERTCSRI